ncbi:Flap endonuclease 1, partial [Fragariocoptes setiger]
MKASIPTDAPAQCLRPQIPVLISGRDALMHADAACLRQENKITWILLLSMGIKQLSKLIADVAPQAIKEQEIKAYFGRRIAIDASTSLYQFLIAIRMQSDLMTNDSGETTSHLIGFLHRTVKLIENGIKPVYVFDGKPPDLKFGELGKRSEKRKEAKEKLDKAVEDNNQEEIIKFNKRLIHVTPKHNEDVKKLLRFMGLPVIDAPSEAEAQCAELCKQGKVWAVATEDMDGLTFGTPRLVRHLTSGSSDSVHEYDLEKVIQGFELESQDEFIDLCILMGCDYCDSIRGIGGKKGLELIRKYKRIEDILDIVKNKEDIPEDWLYEGARRLFKEPEVDNDVTEEDLKPKEMDPEGLVAYLCSEHSFNEQRVRSAIARMKASKTKSSQTRIDSFFKLKPPSDQVAAKKPDAKAAKTPVKKANGPAKNKRFKK